MALPCPACSTTMETIDFRGMMIDVCPKCAGIWFDDIELSELIEKNPELIVQLENAFEPRLESLGAKSDRKACPHGHTDLESFRYFYDSPIELDSCPMCYGVFIENEELGEIADMVREFHGKLSSVLAARKMLTGHNVTSVGNLNEDEATAGLVHALTHWHNRKPED